MLAHVPTSSFGFFICQLAFKLLLGKFRRLSVLLVLLLFPLKGSTLSKLRFQRILMLSKQVDGISCKN